MKSHISDCLLAAGIKNVVWIDDKFATPTYDDLVNSILESLLKLKFEGHPKINVPSFEDIDLTKSKTEIKDVCDDICSIMPEKDLAIAEKQVAVLAGLTPFDQRPQPDDMSPADFESLKQALGANLQCFCYGTWTSRGIKEYQSPSSDTLFLIDKQFNRETVASGTDGTSILKELIGTQAFCIILTHICSSEEQEDERLKIASSNKELLRYRFCVLSKKQDKSLSIDERFARAICALLTHTFNGVIAHTICEAIESNAKATADTLTTLSVFSLEQALFKNTIDGGYQEYEVLLRIFSINQRHALNEALQQNKVQEQLKASRRFREGTSFIKSSVGENNMALFQTWRRWEIFFDGAGLNKMHAPLECGDVFETSTNKRYIIIAQPCDLTVRDKGERNTDTGLFVQIRQPDLSVNAIKLRSVPDYRYYDLKDAFGINKKFFADFLTAFPVNLFILNFAVFNSDGLIRLQRNHPVPPIVLTKGYANFFNLAQAKFFSTNQAPEVPNFGIGEEAAKIKGKSNVNVLEYPLKRIGRLQPATATAVFVAWATFQTRAAFDDDFARMSAKDGLVEAPENPS